MAGAYGTGQEPEEIAKAKITAEGKAKIRNDKAKKRQKKNNELKDLSDDVNDDDIDMSVEKVSESSDPPLKFVDDNDITVVKIG